MGYRGLEPSIYFIDSKKVLLPKYFSLNRIISAMIASAAGVHLLYKIFRNYDGLLALRIF